MTHSYSLAQLAQLLDVQVVGDASHQITGLASLLSAQSSQLSFIANPVYKKHLASSNAGALLIAPELAEQFTGNKLIAKNPYLSFAHASVLFATSPKPTSCIHERAVIAASAQIGADVSIAANAVIGEGVIIEDGVVIGANTVIGDDTVIGSRSQLMANVTIYHGVSIGKNCIIHSGAIIGADGFGFAHHAGEWVKIHQLGSVIIGNNVEIGANTCIDRGALENTSIDDGVIIDNLIQIGHNVRIGKHTAIAAHTAIAGSTTIGNHCTIAGAVGIAGHLVLADQVHITAMSLVSSSITKAGSYSSGVPLAPTKDWRKNAARFRQLDTLAVRLIKLERATQPK